MSPKLRWSLVACYTLELTVLGIWTGGLVVLVVSVIPAVFNTFGAQDAGGLFLTRSFEGYNRLILLAIMILLAGAGWRGWIGQRGFQAISPARVELILLGIMIVVATVIMFGLHPQAAALQVQAFAATGDDARKAAFEAFFRIHLPVRMLYMLNMGLGIALIAIRSRDWLSPRRTS
ncbi:MAG: DUF4149 domain-containing protein [Nitrospiraceae bacterium]